MTIKEAMLSAARLPVLGVLFLLITGIIPSLRAVMEKLFFF